MSHLANMHDARIQEIVEDPEQIRLLANRLAQFRLQNQELTDQVHLLEGRLNESQLQNEQQTNQIHLLQERVA